MKNWNANKTLTSENRDLARQVLEEIRDGRDVTRSLRRYPLPGGGYLAKSVLVAAYNELVDEGEWTEDEALFRRLRMKPVRTLSGVTTVTVLTKPWPCPGKCIFCPDDARMPKSYLPDEPGAARAFQNNFDPWLQVSSRLESYKANGHPTDKVELLILGGCWTSHRRDYQEWFIQRCFDAMNGRDSSSLEEAHRWNENAEQRNVGLVIETRPDEIKPKELQWLRYLGVTKVQLGIQSLDDAILELNKRGHTTGQALQACNLLRAAGFKVVLHWMPNLLGATPDSDRNDFSRLWWGYCPDELKIYPTQLLDDTELYQHWQQGDYHPYEMQTLIDLLADIKLTVPSYCRINRVIRDIPSHHVMAGNKRTSLRQDVQAELRQRGETCQCIRCREVKGEPVDAETLTFRDLNYAAGTSEEHFLHFLTPEDKIAGYLRLSLPTASSPNVDIPEIAGAALIREVHVYGQSVPVGADQAGAAQHSGLGTRLLQYAEELTAARGFSKLSVIAAIGTREYYRSRGFALGELYMDKAVTPPPSEMGEAGGGRAASS
mgnify:FL=1